MTGKSHGRVIGTELDATDEGGGVSNGVGRDQASLDRIFYASEPLSTSGSGWKFRRIFEYIRTCIAKRTWV